MMDLIFIFILDDGRWTMDDFFCSYLLVWVVGFSVCFAVLCFATFD